MPSNLRVPYRNLIGDAHQTEERAAINLNAAEVANRLGLEVEQIERDGLGTWLFLAIRHQKVGLIMFYSPKHDPCAGCFVSTLSELAFEELKQFLHNAFSNLVIIESTAT